jgi:ribosomal-protein-serine acetyltransferase
VFDYALDERHRLKILQRRHAPDLLALVDRDREHLGAFLGWVLRIHTVADAEAFIARGVTRFAEDELPWVGIWQDDTLVGGTLFFPLGDLVRSTEVGYWLDSAAGGRGLMTRSLQVILDHAFDELGVSRIGLQAEVANTASRAVAERLGFQFEGVRRSDWTVGDRVIDSATYALLATDPRPWQLASPT